MGIRNPAPSGGGSTTLAGLTDVNLSGLANADRLIYDLTSGQWMNLPNLLSTLLDVNLSGLANGDRLIYDLASGQWVNLPNLLSTLLDVNLSGLANLDKLIYDSATSRWINRAQPKKYVATVYFSSGSAPSPTVHENTLGGTPVWSNIGFGTYRLTLSGAFSDLSKVFCQFSFKDCDASAPQPSFVMHETTADPNFLQFVSFADDGGWSSGEMGSESVYFEIRVYP